MLIVCYLFVRRFSSATGHFAISEGFWSLDSLTPLGPWLNYSQNPLIMVKLGKTEHLANSWNDYANSKTKNRICCQKLVVLLAANDKRHTQIHGNREQHNCLCKHCKLCIAYKEYLCLYCLSQVLRARQSHPDTGVVNNPAKNVQSVKEKQSSNTPQVILRKPASPMITPRHSRQSDALSRSTSSKKELMVSSI